MYVSVPYYCLVIALKYFTYPPDVNPFRTRHPENSGVKEGYFAKEYMLDDIKRVAKAHKVTVNDLLMTSISMTVKQYFISKGDEKTSYIIMYVPYSVR
jgi:NRPS condensation-like uncharacterized protein